MITLQNNIQDLKKYIKSKLLTIANDVDDLEEDVNFYAEKMYDWSKKVEINKYNSISHYKRNATYLKHSVKVN